MWKDFLATAILSAINLNYFSFHLILALTDRIVHDVAIYELIINEVIACLFPGGLCSYETARILMKQISFSLEYVAL